MYIFILDNIEFCTIHELIEFFWIAYNGKMSREELVFYIENNIEIREVI
jgi:hypothetical protein